MDEIKKSMPLLGKEISVSVFGVESEVAELFFDDIYAEALRLQKIFNFFDKKSELSQLNIRRKMKVGNELLEVIEKAISYSELTGKYDIALGKKITARKQGKPVLDISCSYKDIKITGNLIELTHDDVLLDLGSIAKGYIVDKLTDFMKKTGIESGFIDARGDMRIFGDENLTVNIQHPRIKEKTIHPFSLHEFSVATSGDYRQFHETHDKSHIIGENDFISVTVAGKLLVDADALATCVFLTKKEELKSLLDKKPDYRVFAIDKNMNEHFFNGFEKLLSGKL